MANGPFDFSENRPFDSEKLRNAASKARKHLSKIIIALLLLIIAGIVGFGGFYQLNSGDNGVVVAFGKYVRTETVSGLKFKIPIIEDVKIVNTSEIRRLEFGYRSDSNDDTKALEAAEAHMLTSDENIVLADWAVQYQVTDAYAFLYHVNNPVNTLRIVSESAYRRIVASHPIDDILTTGKEQMQNKIVDELQETVDKYDLGIKILSVQLQDAVPPDEVNPAFLDVVSAKEEKTVKVNDAKTYENEKLPLARGQASKLLNDAEAYKQARINEAEGDVARFNSIRTEYAKNPAITRTRLYIEMIRKVIPSLQSIYFVSNAGDLVEFLPLGPNSTNSVVLPPNNTGSDAVTEAP